MLAAPDRGVGTGQRCKRGKQLPAQWVGPIVAYDLRAGGQPVGSALGSQLAQKSGTGQ